MKEPENMKQHDGRRLGEAPLLGPETRAFSSRRVAKNRTYLSFGGAPNIVTDDAGLMEIAKIVIKALYDAYPGEQLCAQCQNNSLPDTEKDNTSHPGQSADEQTHQSHHDESQSKSPSHRPRIVVNLCGVVSYMDSWPNDQAEPCRTEDVRLNCDVNSGIGSSVLFEPLADIPDWRVTIQPGKPMQVALPLRLYSQYLSLSQTQRQNLKAQIEKDFLRRLTPAEFVEPTQMEADLYAQAQLSRTLDARCRKEEDQSKHSSH